MNLGDAGGGEEEVLSMKFRTRMFAMGPCPKSEESEWKQPSKK
jgi:hypothetical protein